MKVLAIGLDGATWTLIKPWADEGKLPTFNKLLKKGCWGNMESTLPPVTFPAWKCYSTGKNPGKLGVYWWAHPDFKNKTLKINDSKSFKSLELWDYLGKFGKFCGVLGMPTTYPPRKINGFMVSEFNPSNTGYTYPSKLEFELKKLGFNGEYIDYHGRTKEDVFNYCLKSIKERFLAASYLIKKYNPDFMQLTIFHIDAIQHFFWRDMVENKDPIFKNAIEKTWKIIDSEIKQLLDEFNFDYILFVSDHGFTYLKSMFNMYEWAIKNKYLKLNSKLATLLNKLGLLGICSTTTKKLLKILPASNGKKITQKASLSLIDWNKSKIIPLAEGLIYLNPTLRKRLTQEEYIKFIDKLITELKSIKDPKTNDKLVKDIFKKEEVYSGDYLELAPDIIILPNEGYEVTTSFMYGKEWIYEPKEKGWSGVHALHGIFLIYGDEIKEGYQIEKVKIYDIAPTILYLFGLPIPKDMDGNVLTDIFKSCSEFTKKEPRYIHPNFYRLDEEITESKIKKIRFTKKI